MPDGLALAVGVLAGLAGLALPRVLRSTDDSLAVAAVVLSVLMWGTDLAPFAVVLAVGLVLAWDFVAPGPGLVVLVLAGVLFGLSMRTGAEDWLGLLTGAAVVVAVWLSVAAIRAFGQLGTAFLLVSVPFTVYGSVPDTEQITGVAVALAIVVIGVALGPLQVTDRGLHAFAALTVWATAAGALGRHASMVGSLACFGFLLTGWLWWAFRRRLLWRAWIAVPILPLQVLAGVVAARWAGLGSDVEVAAQRALLVAAGVGVVALLAVLLSPRVRGHEAQSAGS